ncbi:MAG: hypothetical protein AABW59_01250 [archaeon]
MTNPLLRNWQITFVVALVIISILLVATMGIKLGLDFQGGTLYQVELQKQVSNEEIARISNIISQRIDPSGLMDASVTPVGGQFIVVQLSETDPVMLEKIESRMRQQGKFEATLNGEIVFTGDEIKKVLRGDNYYGVAKIASTYEWRLPFVLNDVAAKRFAEKTFHQCTATSFAANGTPTYDCEKTVFFLDKPNALIVLTQDEYDLDSDLLATGNRNANIPAGTEIESLIQDANTIIAIVDANNSIDLNLISAALARTDIAIVSPKVLESVKNDLNAAGFEVRNGASVNGEPWIWSNLNARQIISLTENITNEDKSDPAQAEIFSQLSISGGRETLDVAKADLEELTILLESGSLPTPVKSISKETISPSLGESFLNNIILMGVLALIAVALVIVIRYRAPKLVIPIVFTGMSEIIILMGFMSFIQRPLDLAAFAGIIAAIGTGVDSEIVITDEILGKSKHATESLVQRAKAALFIIMTSAFTVLGVMGPIILFSRSLPGLDRLFGFAVVTIFGALVGVFITRPAFTKIVEKIVGSHERKQAKKEETNN